MVRRKRRCATEKTQAELVLQMVEAEREERKQVLIAGLRKAGVNEPPESIAKLSSRPPRTPFPGTSFSGRKISTRGNQRVNDERRAGCLMPDQFDRAGNDEKGIPDRIVLENDLLTRRGGQFAASNIPQQPVQAFEHDRYHVLKKDTCGNVTCAVHATSVTRHL